MPQPSIDGCACSCRTRRDTRRVVPVVTTVALARPELPAHADVFLAPDDRAPVAQNLQLSADGIDRLTQLEPVHSNLSEFLSISLPPSQIVQCLKPYELPLLILVAVKSPRFIRKQIWRYLTLWATVKPLLDGNDLKVLGYKPGRQFKQILDDLLAATLDGKVHDRAQAEAYLAQHYPANS